MNWRFFPSAGTGPAPDPDLTASRLVCLGLLGAVILAYWPSLGADFIGFDDPVYVSRNPDVLRGLTWAEVKWAFTSLRESNWHPLTWLSLQLDSTFYGLQAPGYRITNLLLHWANAALLLTLFARAAGRFWPAALVAGLFALHPQHVESVAWITERKDVLCTFFWLLTMLAYVRYVRDGRLAWLAVSVLCMVLGSMAKQMLVTLPPALLLFDYWPLRRFGPAPAGEAGGPSRAGWRDWLPPARLLWEKLPFLAVAAASAYMTVLAQDPSITPLNRLPLTLRVYNALVSWVSYLDKTFLPRNLAAFYPHPGTALGLGQAAAAGALLLAITGLVLWQARQRRYLAFGWFWFLGTLVPVIGLVQVGAQGMADRYMYVPHMGLFAAVAWGGAELAGRLRIGRRAAWAACLLVLGALGTLTWRQSAVWTDTRVLFTHAAEVTERNYMAHLMIANLAIMRGDMDTYRRHYDLAVEYSKSNTANFHVKLGYSLAYLGDFRGAVYHFTQALQLEPENTVALYNLAVVYRIVKRYDEADEILRRVQRTDPGNAFVGRALDDLHREMGQARRILDAGMTWWNATAWNATAPAPEP